MIIDETASYNLNIDEILNINGNIDEIFKHVNKSFGLNICQYSQTLEKYTRKCLPLSEDKLATATIAFVSFLLFFCDDFDIVGDIKEINKLKFYCYDENVKNAKTLMNLQSG